MNKFYIFVYHTFEVYFEIDVSKLCFYVNLFTCFTRNESRLVIIREKKREEIDWFIWSKRDLSRRLTKEGVNRALEVGRERIGLDLIGIPWELFGVNWGETWE